MDVNDFLQSIQRYGDYRDQIVHIRRIPAQRARYGTLSAPLPKTLQEILAAEGIDKLYEHQSQAIEYARDGRDFVVVTGTASGKTLCYNVPVLESLLADATARAMYIFPTKALAQDQLAKLQHWSAHDETIGAVLRPACYDGDTPSSSRSRIRRTASVILTNPDMLHQGILPYHAKWASFFSNLRYVVVDELHVYRGIFGSQVANVLRRLQRILEFHGADCRFICSSATIGNPVELGKALTGRDLAAILTDGAGRGEKYFVLWNPPFVDQARMIRRSANIEAKRLFTELIRFGVQSIVFTRARVVAELIYKYAVDEFRQQNERHLAKKIRPYRGGYLPEDRREIERELFSGNLLGVCATTALELGIDVGTLDAAVLVGFPGTISSAWQQAGRAGRRSERSLVTLIAYNDPIDQYLMHHPDYFFSRDVEQAIIDPQNTHILRRQLSCAAFELPLHENDEQYFGEQFHPTLRQLTDEDGALSKIVDRWYFSENDFPARSVNLRTISDSTFTIVDRSQDQSPSIGSIDGISAPEQLYPGAVYLHEGRSYLVRDLDMEGKVAYIEPAEIDYYTQPILRSHSQILSDEATSQTPHGQVHFGQLKVVWQTIAFKKIKFYTMETLGQDSLDLPAQQLETRGLWFVPDDAVFEHLGEGGYLPLQAMCGLRNLMIWALPILAMCDPVDIGGQIDVKNFPRPGVVLYDRYLGGLGFARRGYDRFEDLLTLCAAIVRECECDDGCPSCVGLPILRVPLHQDPDLQRGQDLPNKAATMALVDCLLEK